MAELLPWPLIAAIALARVVIAGAFLTVALPWLMFPQRIERDANPWVSRAIWMAFAATATIHLLAAIGLYEASFILVICAIVTVSMRVLVLPANERLTLRVRIVGGLYDLLDGRHRRRAKTAAAETGPGTRSGRWRRPAVWRLLAGLLLIAVLALSARLLFAEAFATPAPAFSDAPVNIAWLKYMEGHQLYHDGLYPLGMYAALSLLRKFTALHAVVLLDVCGPLIGVALLLSVLFFVYKTTRSPAAVLVAALLYGVLPRLLPLDLDRHAGHQSEEYGLIFVLPAAWYVFAYLCHGRRSDRATAAAAAGVAAFTHPVPALFAIVAMVTTGVVALLHNGLTAWRRLPGLIGWVGGAGAIACLPLGIGMLSGRVWHGSSLAYLQTAVADLAPLNPLHLKGLYVTAGLVPLLLLLAWRFGSRVAALASAAATAAAGIGLYLLPHFGLTSQVLADRGKEFGAMGLAIGAALCWSLLERILGRLRPVSLLAVLMIGVCAWRAAPPAPAQPYHYFTPEMIRLYLQADATYLSGSWTLVTGFRGYSLALGRAVHMYPDEFVNMASQMPGDLNKWYEASWRTLTGEMARDKTTIYLLLVERVSPLAPGQNESEAAPVLAQASTLAQWIESAKGRLPLRHIFSNASIDAWTLELPDPTPNPGG